MADGAALPPRIIERGTHTRVVIDAGAPPLHVPVTAAVAYIERNSYSRYQTPRQKTDVFTNACKVPTRVFVQDFFLHEDVCPGFVPTIVARMDNMQHDPSVRDEEMLEIDRLDLDIELKRIGRGLDRVGVREWAGYEPALRSTFERAGWEPSRFRAFRCTIKYPYPFVSMATWFDLPARR